VSGEAPPAGAAPTLYVCVTCRAEGSDPNADRPGARLYRALTRAAAARGCDLRIEPVECLSVCKRPCTVAVAAPGRWTYVYGDLDPEHGAETVLDGVGRYAGTPDGIVPWRERPQAFRTGVVARIPPLAPPLKDAAE
jgi:predicted metal-binding protein